MNQRSAQGRLGASLLLVLLSACSSSLPRAATSPAVRPPAGSPARVELSPANESHTFANSADPPSPDASESDCVFLKNAARAIGQYQAFMARAGSSNEYAGAVQRSREQITDLEAEIEFVRSGMQQRGAVCIADIADRAPSSAIK